MNDLHTTNHTHTDAATMDDHRWRDVLHREAAPEPPFYYAVRTTGVYCRPACPSRRPRRDHTLFFDTPDAAEAAGFRSCRRCNPRGEMTPAQQAVERARALIETLDEEPTLDELGAQVGMAPTHLQRVFKEIVGVSPKQYARAHRLGQFKGHLKTEPTVTDALYDAGYGSSNALYSTAGTHLGMRPIVYRQGAPGVRMAYTLIDSSLGRLLIAATDQGISAVRFGDDEALIRELQTEFPAAQIERDDGLLAPQAEAILAHLAGQQATLDLPLDVQATVFQAKVWNALRSIPYGETRSYAQVAAAIGAPSAVRAVARACATNPVALVVPCHRVIRSNGELSEYRWGAARKRALLRQEGVVSSR